jgi:hypothetical protein
MDFFRVMISVVVFPLPQVIREIVIPIGIIAGTERLVADQQPLQG